MKQRFRYRDFVTDFVAVISSQSEDLGKMALGIVKMYLGSPFSANCRCLLSVCSRSVGSRSVCRGQLSWTRQKCRRNWQAWRTFFFAPRFRLAGHKWTFFQGLYGIFLTYSPDFRQNRTCFPWLSFKNPYVFHDPILQNILFPWLSEYKRTV